MAFSKSLQKGQIPVGCELCDGGNKIQFKCLDCELLMCSRCKEKVHARFKNATEHIIKDIKELGQQEEVDRFNFSDIKCSDHSNQACCVYCKTCKKVVCVKCVTKVHNGHTFIDEEEFDDKKKIINSGQKKAERSINDLSISSEKIWSIKQQEDVKFRQIKKDILTHREALKSEVDKYADNLVKDLEQTWKSNKRIIGAEDSRIDKTLENLQTDNKTVKSAITSKDFVKFIEDFDKLVVSLGKLDKPLSNLQFSLLGKFMPGNITISNFGSVEEGGILEVQQPKIEMQVTKQFITQLRNFHHIERCPDGSLWIYDGNSNKLQCIKFNKDNIQIMLDFDIQIFGIVVMNVCNNILIAARGETRLKIIVSNTGQITYSNYDVKPYISQSIPNCVHLTNDNKIIVGVGRSKNKAAVIVMFQDGRYLAKYTHYCNRERLFTSPKKITSTNNGNICIIDVIDSGHGRMVVLGKDGAIRQVYTGYHIINFDKKSFTPTDLLTTPADNIIITDLFTSTLHVLNCEGNFIGYYNVFDIGIIYPCSLALSTEGHIFIGCSNHRESPKNLKAKLYELKYSGF